jgi:hypothetical protein
MHLISAVKLADSSLAKYAFKLYENYNIFCTPNKLRKTNSIYSYVGFEVFTAVVMKSTTL